MRSAPILTRMGRSLCGAAEPAKTLTWSLSLSLTGIADFLFVFIAFHFIIRSFKALEGPTEVQIHLDSKSSALSVIMNSVKR